jgi:hypothetical protein
MTESGNLPFFHQRFMTEKAKRSASQPRVSPKSTGPKKARLPVASLEVNDQLYRHFIENLPI